MLCAVLGVRERFENDVNRILFVCLCIRFISVNLRCGWSHTPTEGRHVSFPSREIPPGWPEPPGMPFRGLRSLELLVPACVVSTQRTTSSACIGLWTNYCVAYYSA